MRIRMFSFWLRVAKLLPKRLLYASYIKVLAFATTGEYSNTDVNTITAIEALRRYEEKG